MKKMILLLFLSPIYVNAHNWFPLNIGNEWQYIQIEYTHDLPTLDTILFRVNLVNDKVLRDSTINSQIYFKRSFEPDLWYRYSNPEEKIFIWWNDADRLIMDFTLPEDSFFIGYWDQNEVYAKVIEGNLNLFDSTYFYKGYDWFLVADFYERNKYVKNFGLVDYYFDWEDGVMLFDYKKYKYLIQANIDSNNYSKSVSPEILITPQISISDSSFHLNFVVNHEYNILIPNPAYTYTGLNFIDSVYFYSFYSRDDSIVTNRPLSAENIPNSTEWIINASLNLKLLNDNFNYNYKFEAIDKGLNPHKSFAPDSGYFIAVYDTTSDVKETFLNPELAILEQNYPNPFNPTTNIGFRIADFGFVTLKVYDVLGNEIAALVNEEKPAGEYEVEFNPSTIIHHPTSGIYFYQLIAGSFIQTKKMILIK
jgi:hypothetical protein